MFRAHRSLLPLVVLLVPLAAPGADKEDTWAVPRGPSREPNPYRFDPALLKTVPRDFLEDAAACVLYSGTTHLLEPDGTVETISHELTRLNGRKGVEKIGEYHNLVYTPAYQKLTLNVARVHKPDGKIVEVRPRDTQLRDVSTDFLSYDPDKQLIISFPSLEVGDVLEVKWTVRGKNPEHSGQFFTRYSFGDVSYPVLLDEIRIRLPSDKKLLYACSPATRPSFHAIAGKVDSKPLTPTITEADGQRLFHWKLDRCPPLPRDENLPSREELRPSVLCSTFTSWKEVGEWKQRLREDCWKCTPAVTQVVGEVTKGLTAPLDRARALTYWVRRNIRYVSSGERHDYTPHPPEKVLANRFGDCKDGSQLLAVMLREAGIAVELATLGVQDDGQVHKDVPSPWGTHAILLARIDGKEHWIDTTSRLSGWDYLPADDRDRVCYLTDERGHVRLASTPPLTPADHRWEQTTEIWIGSDGNARCRRTAMAYGSSAISQRDRFVEVPAGERRRQVASDLQDANSRSHLLRLELDEPALRDHDRPTTARMEFEIPRMFTGSSELEGSLTDSKVWNRLLAYNLDPDRTVPFVLPGPFESTHRYIIHLSPAHVLDELPRSKILRSAWGTFEVSAKPLDATEPIRHLEVTFRTCIDKPRVEEGDFETFRKFHEDVNRDYRAWLTLKPASDPASIDLLEAYLTFVPSDNVAAGVLAKLYHARGKGGEALRVLRRTRTYLPDDEKLLDLMVKFAEGSAAEEEAQRELIKRQPDKLEHQLALGTVLVSHGKQKEARAVLEPLTKKGSSLVQAMAHYQLARSYYRKDEPARALEQLDASGKLDPDTAGTVRALMLRGQVLEELKKPEQALASYQMAHRAERANQEVLLSVIRLAILTEKRTEALDALRRYTLLVENDLSGLLLAAETYLKLGRLDDAFDLAVKARDLRFHERAQRIMGLVYLQKGDDERAILHLERAEPDAVVLAALMRAYLHVGNLREASDQMERAERLDRPSPELRRACEQIQRVRARRAELHKLASAAPGKEGDLPAALDALACAEAVRSRGTSAEKVERLLAPALAEGMRIGPALALRGLLALERGKLTRALADAEEAIRLSPREPLGYQVRGRVALERGTPAALADLQKAVDLSGGKDADALAGLAEALLRAGRHDEAVAAQRQAVKLRPGDRELAEQLTAMEKRTR
jgi:tetratricopeptide (TPR) repeat protein/transglutaminase-like putative cysteine protease